MDMRVPGISRRVVVAQAWRWWRLPAAAAAAGLLLLVAAFALPWGRPAAPIREVVLEARGVKWSGENPTLTARVGERLDRKSTRLNSSHIQKSRMPSSA